MLKSKIVPNRHKAKLVHPLEQRVVCSYLPVSEESKVMNHIMGKMRMPAMPRLTVSASYFSQIMDCSNPDIHRVLPDISSSVFVLKGSKIIDFGQKHTCFHLLEKSIARAHGLSADGDEVTDRLVFVPGTPVMTSADATTLSPECFEALTDCNLIKLKFRISTEQQKVPLNFCPFIIRCLRVHDTITGKPKTPSGASAQRIDTNSF